MKEERINVIPVKHMRGVAAIALFTYDNLYCGAATIHRKPNGGHRLVYISKELNTQVDPFHPTTALLERYIEEKIISKYKEVINNARNRHRNTNPRST